MDEFQRERWRGEVDTEIRNVKREVNDMRSDVQQAEKTLRDLELRVQTLATKIAIYASLGAAVGGGIMSIIVGLFFKK